LEPVDGRGGHWAKTWDGLNNGFDELRKPELIALLVIDSYMSSTLIRVKQRTQEELVILYASSVARDKGDPQQVRLQKPLPEAIGTLLRKRWIEALLDTHYETLGDELGTDGTLAVLGAVDDEHRRYLMGTTTFPENTRLQWIIEVSNLLAAYVKALSSSDESSAISQLKTLLESKPHPSKCSK